MADRWRGVVAALADAPTRELYARVVLEEPIADPADERRIGSLLAAGLVVRGEDGRLAAGEQGLRMLLAEAPPAPPSGTDRYYRDGRLHAYPRRRADRDAVLRRIAEDVLGDDDRLTEQQLDRRLDGITDDRALLRRTLVDEGVLARLPDGSAYWRAD